jgi:hypothetical protein
MFGFDVRDRGRGELAEWRRWAAREAMAARDSEGERWREEGTETGAAGEVKATGRSAQDANG